MASRRAVGTNRKELLLNDLSDLEQLRRYAVNAQIDYLVSPESPLRGAMNQTDIAVLYRRRVQSRAKGDAEDVEPDEIVNDRRERGLATSNLSKRLDKPSIEFLRDMDAIILGKAPQMSRAGGLAAFAARLAGVRAADNVEATASPFYHPLLLEVRNPPAVVVLLQASILLNEFRDRGRSVYEVLQVQKESLQHVVDNLIRIGGLPPTPYSVDALVLLGGLGRYAFPVVSDKLSRALTTPLGFRVWRAITAMVSGLDADQSDVHDQQEMEFWVRRQLKLSPQLREQSLYPARSLDLELAIAIPKAWSPPLSDDDWAGKLLLARAEDSTVALRERGTAAFGYWERAIDGPRQADAEHVLRTLVERFRQEGTERAGMDWLAETLGKNLDEKRKILTSWEGIKHSCRNVLNDASQELRVPAQIRAATALLVEHAVLKNAGVYRRRAIDTLRAGGWAAHVVSALAVVLRHPESEPWLRCRALFALGFLQERSGRVQVVLSEACTKTWRGIVETTAELSPDDPRVRVRYTELHAALFAVGDAFGVPDALKEAENIRNDLHDLLHEIIGAVRADHTDRLTLVGRAVAYLLGTTAHVYPGTTKAMLELLVVVDDLPTRRMAQWGLARILGEDNVRPAHEVPF